MVNNQISRRNNMNKMTIQRIKQKIKSENPACLDDIEFVRDCLTNRLEFTDNSNDDEYNRIISDYAERNFHTDWPTVLAESLSLDEEKFDLFVEFYAHHPNIIQGMNKEGSKLIISPNSPTNMTGMAGITSPAFFFAGLKLMKKRYRSAASPYTIH